MLLCEQDRSTLDQLRQWVNELNIIEIEIAEGDWRERFRRGLPPQQGLTLVSFDPYMFNRHNREDRKPGNMYPDDLDILAAATQIYRENIIVQLSTYSANDDNSQKDVIECIHPRLTQEGFKKAAVVKLNGNMMSLVFQRGVEFAGELGNSRADSEIGFVEAAQIGNGPWTPARRSAPAELTARAQRGDVRLVIAGAAQLRRTGAAGRFG